MPTARSTCCGIARRTRETAIRRTLIERRREALGEVMMRRPEGVCAWRCSLLVLCSYPAVVGVTRSSPAPAGAGARTVRE